MTNTKCIGVSVIYSLPCAFSQDGDPEGWWEETFNGHTDSKPAGPEAISIDISFPGSQHVYGIPERATNLALQPTAGGALCQMVVGVTAPWTHTLSPTTFATRSSTGVVTYVLTHLLELTPTFCVRCLVCARVFPLLRCPCETVRLASFVRPSGKADVLVAACAKCPLRCK